MEANYIVLLDYCNSEIIKIRLSEAEKIAMDGFKDMEEFLLTLEGRYGFRLNNCCWMACGDLSERSFS